MLRLRLRQVAFAEVAARTPNLARMSLPQPPALDGVTWRPAAADDAGRVADLHNAAFKTDGGYRVTATEIRNELENPDNDPATDSLIALDDARGAVAFVLVLMSSAFENELKVHSAVLTHPEWRGRGIEDFLLDWYEARGRERAQAVDTSVPKLFRGWAYDWQQAKIDRLQGRGYEPTRYFTELAQPLDRPIEPAPLADGYEIHPWPDDSEPIRLLHNAAFQDHWGAEPRSAEEWRRYTLDEFFRQDLSFIAVHDGEPAAYLHTAVYPHDFEDRGRSEAWVEILGTARGHRKRGLASALVTRALAAYRDDGFDYAVIGVDSDSLTGALRLYESLGFGKERSSIVFAKPIEG